MVDKLITTPKGGEVWRGALKGSLGKVYEVRIFMDVDYSRMTLAIDDEYRTLPFLEWFYPLVNISPCGEKSLPSNVYGPSPMVPMLEFMRKVQGSDISETLDELVKRYAASIKQCEELEGKLRSSTAIIDMLRDDIDALLAKNAEKESS